jgi:hypothetical protein
VLRTRRSTTELTALSAFIVVAGVSPANSEQDRVAEHGMTVGILTPFAVLDSESQECALLLHESPLSVS